jgi:hypothetical protein
MKTITTAAPAPKGIPKEQLKELQDSLKAAVLAWCEKHNRVPDGMWTIPRITESKEDFVKHEGETITVSALINDPVSKKCHLVEVGLS